MTRGIARQIIFEDDDDFAYFKTRAFSAIERLGGSILAWCLMDNHVHLLIRIPFSELALSMRTIFASYAGYFNRVHERSGNLFDGRYKSEPVDTDEYLMTVVRYIHLNPVKAGLSPTPDYRWSSYRDYLSPRTFPEKDFVMSLFGNTDAFVAFHEAPNEDHCLDNERAAPRRLSDEKATRVAREVLGELRLNEIKSLGRQDRDRAISTLKKSHLSARQIQRLTGLPLGTISRAGR